MRQGFFLVVLFLVNISCPLFAQEYSVGHVWDPGSDWVNRPDSDFGTSNGNPADDSLGNSVYSYEYFVGVPANANLDSAKPWYLYPRKKLVWDNNWYGQVKYGSWVYADNTLPGASLNTISVNTTGACHHGWVNPLSEPARIQIVAQNWYFGLPQSGTVVDWAVCFVDVSEGGAISVIDSNRVYRPAGEDYVTEIPEPVFDEIVVEPGDSIFFTAKQVSGWYSSFVSRFLITYVGKLEQELSTSSTLGGSVSVPGEGEFSFPMEEQVEVVAIPDDHYHFVSWTGSAVDAGKVADATFASTTVTMDADYTLVANFAIDTHVLGVVSGGHGSATGSGTYAWGSVVPISATADDHHHFVSWSTSGSVAVTDTSSANTTVTIGGDGTVTANFSIDTHSLSVTSGGHGTVTGSGAYDWGTSASISATAEDHYHFVSWTGSAVDAGKVADASAASTTVAMDADYDLMANFAIDTHTLTTSSTVGGSVTTPGEGVNSYDYGTVVNLVAVADDHYHFVEWIGPVADTTSQTTSVTVSEDMDVQAVFALDQFVVTFSSSAGGSIDDPGEGEFAYDYDTVLRINAEVDDPLFEFSHFEGNLWAGYSPYNSYTVKCDAAIRAVFYSTLDVLYVDANASEGHYENGTDEYPFATIQAAIEVAAPDSTVVVRSGVYAENLELPRKSFVLTGVDVNDANDWAFPVIQGVDDAPVITVNRCGTADIHLQGLVIRQGDGRLVGGIDCSNSQLTLSNCLIIGNRCDRIQGRAGALRAYGSQVDLINCTISGNYSSANGAAVCVAMGSQVTVLDSILWDNDPIELICDETSQVVVQYSDVTDVTEGAWNLSMDPEFLLPGDWVHALDFGSQVSASHSYAVWKSGDYHLADTSPCIKAGDPNEASADLGAYGNTPEAAIVVK